MRTLLVKLPHIAYPLSQALLGGMMREELHLTQPAQRHKWGRFGLQMGRRPLANQATVIEGLAIPNQAQL